MSSIATTIEQSRHLLELGLDPKTADMSYTYFDKGEPWLDLTPYMLNSRISDPAWSLRVLLEVMPKENEPDLQKSPATGQYFMYGFFDLEKPTYMTKDYYSPVDAAYEMVCWILEQGLIKKGGQDDSKN